MFLLALLHKCRTGFCQIRTFFIGCWDKESINVISIFFDQLRYIDDCDHRSLYILLILSGTTMNSFKQHHAVVLWLAFGIYGGNFQNTISKLIIQNSSSGTCCEFFFMLMLQNLTNRKSALDQIMTCCLTLTIHYLRQCWLRYKLPHGIAWPWRWLGDSVYTLY